MSLTAEERTVIKAELSKRARLHVGRPARPGKAAVEPPSVQSERVAELERANLALIEHLNVSDACLVDTRRENERLQRELARSEQAAGHYRRVAEAQGHSGWLAAERQIVELRQQLEAVKAA